MDVFALMQLLKEVRKYVWELQTLLCIRSGQIMICGSLSLKMYYSSFEREVHDIDILILTDEELRKRIMLYASHMGATESYGMNSVMINKTILGKPINLLLEDNPEVFYSEMGQSINVDGGTVFFSKPEYVMFAKMMFASSKALRNGNPSQSIEYLRPKDKEDFAEFYKWENKTHIVNPEVLFLFHRKCQLRQGFRGYDEISGQVQAFKDDSKTLSVRPDYNLIAEYIFRKVSWSLWFRALIKAVVIPIKD